jgi:hypothetical protein
MRSRPWVAAVTFVAILCVSVSSVYAETYRWKDNNGKTHYGATVPAEYADQPYDVLNNAGLVIKHVEKSSTPIEVKVKEEIKGRQPLISDEERQRQTDRLLVIQYRSEEDIQKALDLELAQLGYDSKLIIQSQESTTNAIREQIRLAANRQRANIQIEVKQQQEIEKLYARHERDKKKLVAVSKRGDRIRDRYQASLERYRFLISEQKRIDEERADQG